MRSHIRRMLTYVVRDELREIVVLCISDHRNSPLSVPKIKPPKLCIFSTTCTSRICTTLYMRSSIACHVATLKLCAKVATTIHAAAIGETQMPIIGGRQRKA